MDGPFDAAGCLSILQTRPLRIAAFQSSLDREAVAVSEKYPVLLRNQGVVACRGIGAGRACIVTGDEDLSNLPRDAVLVAKTPTPRLAAALARASALITDMGTVTGHLATMAREFRVPAIMDAQVATLVLRDVGEVTVDAEENIVYQGRVEELLHTQLLRSSNYADVAEFRMLRRMLKSIAPLNLRDPQSSAFHWQTAGRIATLSALRMKRRWRNSRPVACNCRPAAA